MVLSIILFATIASVSAKPLIGRNEGVLESLLRRDPNSCSGSAKQSCSDGDRVGESYNLPYFEGNSPFLSSFGTLILSNAGANDTLSFMKDYWQDINGNDENFWKHEWAKHGTCMSTFEADCFPGPRGSEAAAFFETAVSLFKKLPTYDFLKDAGIEPSSTQTYSYSSIQSALRKAAGGVDVQVSCRGSQLNSVAYYFNVIGSPVNGQWVSVDANNKGHCPSKVSYKPKSS
ncbi:ribonuclease T2-like protein [Flagelloscypha sp. PMI_526]|nr:ribonuclease T2-like protein [Flagelloscypha sp. PMI_526]